MNNALVVSSTPSTLVNLGVHSQLVQGVVGYFAAQVKSFHELAKANENTFNNINSTLVEMNRNIENKLSQHALKVETEIKDLKQALQQMQQMQQSIAPVPDPALVYNESKSKSKTNSKTHSRKSKTNKKKTLEYKISESIVDQNVNDMDMAMEENPLQDDLEKDFIYLILLGFCTKKKKKRWCWLPWRPQGDSAQPLGFVVYVPSMLEWLKFFSDSVNKKKYTLKLLIPFLQSLRGDLQVTRDDYAEAADHSQCLRKNQRERGVLLRAEGKFTGDVAGVTKQILRDIIILSAKKVDPLFTRVVDKHPDLLELLKNNDWKDTFEPKRTSHKNADIFNSAYIPLEDFFTHYKKYFGDVDTKLDIDFFHRNVEDNQDVVEEVVEEEERPKKKKKKKRKRSRRSSSRSPSPKPTASRKKAKSTQPAHRKTAGKAPRTHSLPEIHQAPRTPMISDANEDELGKQGSETDPETEENNLE